MEAPLFQIYTNINNVRISNFCVGVPEKAEIIGPFVVNQSFTGCIEFMHDETEVSVLSSNEFINSYIVEGCFNRTETIETVLIDASRPE